MAASDCKPQPKKNEAYQLQADLWLTTGLPNIGPAGLDSEISKDGGSYTDCVNEWTEIGSSGSGTLDLTSTEMNCDVARVQIKSSTTNAITAKYTIVLTETGDWQVNATQLGSQAVSASGTIAFPSSVGTSTLTQAQVTGGAYALNSASFAWSSGLDFTTTEKASIAASAVASVTGSVASVSGNVGGNVTGSVGGIATGGIAASSFASGAIDATAIASSAITAAKIATDAITSSQLAASAATEIATATRDINNTSPAANSLGAAVNSAASAGDPWATALPGAYGSGTAGKIVGDNINATITSRMASYSQPTGFLAATFPATVAAQGDIPTGNQNADALLKRDWTAVSGESNYSVLQALRFLRNVWNTTETPGTLTVKKEDGTTDAWTRPIDTDPAAEPITGVE